MPLELAAIISLTSTLVRIVGSPAITCNALRKSYQTAPLIINTECNVIESALRMFYFHVELRNALIAEHLVGSSPLHDLVKTALNGVIHSFAMLEKELENYIGQDKTADEYT